MKVAAVARSIEVEQIDGHAERESGQRDENRAVERIAKMDDCPRQLIHLVSRLVKCRAVTENETRELRQQYIFNPPQQHDDVRIETKVRSMVETRLDNLVIGSNRNSRMQPCIDQRSSQHRT